MSPPSVAIRLEVVVFPSTAVPKSAPGEVRRPLRADAHGRGVVLAVTLTFAQIDQGTKGLALTFLVWLQGFLIWAVRRHSRLARSRLIRKLRVMLQDRVNNQLTVLIGVAELRGTVGMSSDSEDVETALTAARAVSQELETSLAGDAASLGSPVRAPPPRAAALKSRSSARSRAFCGHAPVSVGAHPLADSLRGSAVARDWLLLPESQP